MAFWALAIVGGVAGVDRWHYLALALLSAVSALIVFQLRQRPGTKRIAAAAGLLIPMMAIPLTWEYFGYFFAPNRTDIKWSWILDTPCC